MASDDKRARREKAKRKAKAPAAHRQSTPEAESVLRHRSDPRTERRFEAKIAAGAIASMIVASIATVAAGAGFYAQFIHTGDGAPHKYAGYAPYLLIGGVLVVVAVALFGQRPSPVIRVGDAGVAIEKSAAEIERVGWYEVTRVLLSDGLLRFQASGTSVNIPVAVHRDAAARALAEARDRIPARIDAEVSVEPLDPEAGDLINLEPPQVAGLHCKNSDKLISFEKDGRLCGRCGEVYHKNGAPRRCATCNARFA
jgi:hypothetical protein